MKRLSYIILFILLLQGFSAVPVYSQDEQKEYYVVYDQGHGQFFDKDLMSTALNSLATAFNRTNINIIYNSDPFNTTNLQGSDLVIITNPGLDENNETIKIDADETDALDDYLSLGGSVFYLSNPFTFNRTISGHAKPLNDLLVTGLNARIKTSPIDNENVSIILDDINNDGNASHIYVDPSNIYLDTLYTETNNLTQSKFLYYGALVETSDVLFDAYGNSSEFAYAVNQEYEIAQETFQHSPLWMQGTEFQDEYGRAMLIGSTIMFSDMAYDNNTKWIDQESNLELFQNFIAWLLKITPSPELDNIVDEDWSFFAEYNIIFAFGFALFLALVWFTYLVLTGKLSITEIFNIRIPKKQKVAKTEPKAKKVTKGSKKAEPQKKRRKRN
jgi:hypothetical protein